jgi:hypothetical protein
MGSSVALHQFSVGRIDFDRGGRRRGAGGWLIVLKLCVPAATSAVNRPPHSGEICCRPFTEVHRRLFFR